MYKIERNNLGGRKTSSKPQINVEYIKFCRVALLEKVTVLEEVSIDSMVNEKP